MEGFSNKKQEIARLPIGFEDICPGGLYEDILNLWFVPFSIESLEKKPKYEDSYSHQDGQERFADIVKKSDSDAIVKYNKLVEEFNEELDQIKQNKDKKKIKKYFVKVNKIVRNE